VLDQEGGRPAMDLDLDQVDAERASLRERACRAPAPREGTGLEASSGPEALPGAPRLDLDHHERVRRRRAGRLEQHEVELPPAGAQASCEQAPSRPTQVTRGQTLARASQGLVVEQARTQAELGNEMRAQAPEREPDTLREPGAGCPQALLGSAFSPFSSGSASFSGSITACTAAREKRRRTLSATCSTTISLVVVTTVP